MSTYYLNKLLSVLLLSFICFNTSNGQSSTNNTGQLNSTSSLTYPEKDPKLQISQYIRHIYQDRSGIIWLGTNGDGVCRYDPSAAARGSSKTLTYFTMREGFSGTAVRGIAEDKAGNVWFGTDCGISKYDGKRFTNFTLGDGLINNDIWSLLIDRNGTVWAGTIDGVCCYNTSVPHKKGAKLFTSFPIPAATERDLSRGVTSTKVIWDMKEDRAGNIWFATNGCGVYRYDPKANRSNKAKALTNISKNEGLSNNFVNSILEDKKGNLWFATQQNGICRYNPSATAMSGLNLFTVFNKDSGLCGNEAWRLYEDSKGNIWISVRGSVCRYDGKFFTNFSDIDGLTNCCVQSIYEDRSGKLWFGSGAGLFRYDPSVAPGSKSFINVTKNGPWE